MSNIVLLSRRSISWPSKSELRAFKGNFGGLVIPELQYGFPNKVLFTPGYVVESDRVRAIIRERYKEAGFTHFPINTYNNTSIYHNVYPNWDDSRINEYLTELLVDGIIPVCSVLPDNSYTIKGNAARELVPICFWWEDPAPIIRPAKDSQNKFYIVKQAYPDSLVYWHNPSGQGAPYYYAPDWGYPVGTELNHIVWNYIVHECDVQGLLFQSDGWKNNGNDSVNRLNDFIYRLVQGNNGWPVADLVDFEEVAFFNTNMQGSPLLTGEFIRTRVTGINGFCNG